MRGKSIFKRVFETVFFGTVPQVQKLFSGYNSYTYIPTQLRAHSLKITSAEVRMWKYKNEQKLTIIYHTNTFVPGNPSEQSFKSISLDSRKLTYSEANTSFLCYISYALKPVDRGSKMVFFGLSWYIKSCNSNWNLN